MFYLWIRACLIGNELIKKLHNNDDSSQPKLETQLGSFDQYFGMIFGKPENYQLYSPELLPNIKQTRLAFKKAIYGIIIFVGILILSNAL